MSKKGENIYKRKDRRWEARYIKGRAVNGRIQYGYCYGTSYREAKERAEKAKAALLTHTPISGSGGKKRFSAYCDEWLQISQNRVKESSYIKYWTIVERHIRPKLGEYLLTELSTMHMEKFSRALLEDGLAPKTVRDILNVTRSILKYTAKHFPGTMQFIDMAYPKETKREMRILTPEEQTGFVRYLLTDMEPCKFGVLLALLTGLRIGELCALRWGDISPETGAIRVASTMQRLKNTESDACKKTKILISQPKSSASARWIPLSDDAETLCGHWRVSDPNAFVLTGRADRYIEPRTLQYRFMQYAKVCGLDHIHFHVLRHTFATRCVEVGVEIKSLSEILGHTSPQFTLERYVHASMELKRNELKKLGAVLPQASG